MTIIWLIATILTAEQAPQAAAAQPCNPAARGSNQLRYKPYGNAIFGSDGIVCGPLMDTLKKNKPENEVSGTKRRPPTVDPAKLTARP